MQLAFADHTSGDGSDLRDLEDFEHLDRCHDLLLHHGFQHAFDGVLDVVDGVVDDRVEADFDLLFLGQPARRSRRAHLEADDDGVRSGGQQDVRLRNLTYGGVDDVDLHGLFREFDERSGHSLDRSVHVALDDDVQLLERADGDAAADLVERHVLLGHDALHAGQLFALVGDLARRAVVVHDVERVAGLRGAVQAQHLYGCRGTCRFHLFAVLVEHGFHAARVGSREDHVADAERSALHQDRRNIAAALVERRLDHRTLRLLVGIGFQVEHLGFQQHLFEQFVEVDALFGRDLLVLVFTAPRLHEVVHLRELLLDVVRVGVGFVDLVDGEDHRYAGGLRVVDRLDGLRHDAVVGRDDDDGDVRDSGAARTHGRKGFVARGVEERDLLSVQHYAVSSDVLGDTAGLALDDVGLADVVQQRGLTVVDVSHDRHDRRTRNQILLLVLAFVGDGLLNLHGDEFGLVTELLGDDHERLGVETLVDRHHQSEVHAGHDDLRRRDVHHRSQLADGHELRDFERRTLHFLAFVFFVHALGHSFALVLAVFRALALGTLGRQARQGVLYLLRNLLVAHFGAHDRFGSVFTLVAASFARTGLVVLSALSVAVLALSARTVVLTALAALSLAVAAALRIAFRGLADVDLLLLETFALVLAAGDEARHVHRAEHLRTREGHGLRAENIIFRSLGLRGFRSGGRSCRFGSFGSFGSFRLGLRSRSGCFGLHFGSWGRSRRFGRFGGFGSRFRLGLRSRSGCFGLHLGCRGRRRSDGLRSFGSLRGLLRPGLRSRCGLGLGFGRKVDLAEEFRLLNLVLYADDIAFDDNLFFFLALLLFGFFEGNGRLLQGDAFTDRVACAGSAAVGPELFLQNGISVRVDQCVGRPVAFDALLLQEICDRVQTDVELLCNLNEP